MVAAGVSATVRLKPLPLQSTSPPSIEPSPDVVSCHLSRCPSHHRRPVNDVHEEDEGELTAGDTHHCRAILAPIQAVHHDGDDEHIPDPLRPQGDLDHSGHTSNPSPDTASTSPACARLRPQPLESPLVRRCPDATACTACPLSSRLACQ
ncbi:hypothetical protein ACLOJK_014734 [Asimina triloba]